MKRCIFLSLLFLSVLRGNGQNDTVARRGGLVALNFSQASLTNWAAGGQNAVSGNAIVNYFSQYKRGKKAWDNNFSLGYGLIMQGKANRFIKSDDKIDLTSRYGWEVSRRWNISALVNFRSQFTAGYAYPNDSVVISRFFAPAYLTIAPGFDYRPGADFSLFLSPVTTRFIFVTDKRLSQAGAFGVDPGERMRLEAGGYVKAALIKNLSEDLNLATSLDLFSNFLDRPENVDVNWQMLLVLKVSKYISASLSTQLLYDDNTKVTTYKSDGITVDRSGPRTQFKEVLGIGFAYKFMGYSLR
ncbi:DUF3078 domain-containing protein [Paraflavisolibacter sp. H34]|uniref:DUF3078 domain-containing protein n=1 Tax=Huijunlia imazamoxiresistens TaxID=3127457 RepID=UPI0030195492